MGSDVLAPQPDTQPATHAVDTARIAVVHESDADGLADIFMAAQ